MTRCPACEREADHSTGWHHDCATTAFRHVLGRGLFAEAVVLGALGVALDELRVKGLWPPAPKALGVAEWGVITPILHPYPRLAEREGEVCDACGGRGFIEVMLGNSPREQFCSCAYGDALRRREN